MTNLSKRILKWVGHSAREPLVARSRKKLGLREPTTRDFFVSQTKHLDSVLEIGPFDNPLLRGPNVSYFDVLDTDRLRERARGCGRNPDNVPWIRYVSATGDLMIIPERFDAVLSCHVVEHQPDMIKHLKHVHNLVRPGGRYMIVVPDKRFTFDRFMPETEIDDLVAAHDENRIIHTPQNVAAHVLHSTHNSAIKHWLGIHGTPAAGADRKLIANDASARAARGEYIDVHAWIFTPQNLLHCLRSLLTSGHVPFKTIDVHDTAFPDAEFFAVLTA